MTASTPMKTRGSSFREQRRDLITIILVMDSAVMILGIKTPTAVQFSLILLPTLSLSVSLNHGFFAYRSSRHTVNNMLAPRSLILLVIGITLVTVNGSNRANTPPRKQFQDQAMQTLEGLLGKKPALTDRFEDLGVSKDTVDELIADVIRKHDAIPKPNQSIQTVQDFLDIEFKRYKNKSPSVN